MENRRKPAPPATTLDINCDCKEAVIDYLTRAFPVQQMTFFRDDTGEVPWQIVDPVVDFDVALIFQEPDEAPDPCCLVSLVVRLLRRIPVAPAPMLFEPPDSPIVNRADGDPMQAQPMQEMADRRAIQNRTA